MAKCEGCGKPIPDSKVLCLPCSLSEEALDAEEKKASKQVVGSFERFKKIKPKEK